MSGKVYLVGGGPGDPGLLTLKAKQILAVADVVVYDRLVDVRVLAMSASHAEQIDVGKGAGDSFTQEKINQLLVEKAREGKCVARLKGGDPFLFGRGGEEAFYLVEQGVSFEVVPGVTAAVGAAAYAGIPLTHREAASSLVFVTGHEDPGKTVASVDWKSVARMDTIVIYMGVSTFPRVIAALEAAGRSLATPVALIQWGTRAEQRVVVGTLADIEKKRVGVGLTPPVLAVVGEVVQYRETLNWFEQKALFGKRIVVTRAREQASQFADLLTAAGADVYAFPTIRFEPLIRSSQDWPAVPDFDKVDWLIFTSPNAISFFAQALLLKGADWRAFHRAKFAAIGPGTAQKLAEMGCRVDLMPRETFQAEGLIEAFSQEAMRGKEVIMPRAEEARVDLVNALQQQGARVTLLPLYRTVQESLHSAWLRQLWEEGALDLVTFTSTSTVTYFCEGVQIPREERGKVPVACIGPITANAAKQEGFRVVLTSPSSTIPHFSEAIIRYFQRG